MAIENTTIIIALGLMFNYFILYKKNKFFGNIMYILTGIATMYFGSTLTGADANITVIIGVIITLGSILNMIYDTFYAGKNRKN